MRSSGRAAAEARGPWAGRRAGLPPGSDPALARPPREVSGRRPPSASRRLPPERSPRCTLGAGARAARPGRADPAGGRGAGRSVSAGGAREADRYSLRGEGGLCPPPCSCGGAGEQAEGREGLAGGTQAHSSGAAALRLPWVTRAQARQREEERGRPAGARAPGPRGAGRGGCPGLGGGRARAAEGRGPSAAHACGPAPLGLASLVRAHARCPPEASGCAERARAARRRTCEVSLEEREGGWVRGARGLGRLNPSLGVSSWAAGLQSLYFFSGPRRGGGGEGERARGWERA